MTTNTTEEQALALIPSQSVELTPSQFEQALANARKKANQLKQVVDEKDWTVMLGKNQHLKVEGWIFLGQGYGLRADTRLAAIDMPTWERNSVTGEIEGAYGYATLLNTDGQQCGGAIAYCGRDEKNWVNSDHYALLGMAQTRAVSRAFREQLSWVVALAGYNPTPYEETIQDEDEESARNREARNREARNRQIPAANPSPAARNNPAPQAQDKSDGDMETTYEQWGSLGTMGSCITHNKNFLRRQGPYGGFWSDGEQDAQNAFCKMTPGDWLDDQLNRLGLKTEQQRDSMAPDGHRYSDYVTKAAVKQPEMPFVDLVSWYASKVQELEDSLSAQIDVSPSILEGSVEALDGESVR
jgi:hypothetical protein